MPASVSRRGRVSEAIVHRIKKQITDGRLLAGHKLPAEREMARQFKTSRVSVREAYRSLEEVGVLRIRRGADGGAFIAQLDHQPVLRSLALVLGLGGTSHHELTEARMLIEPPIARLAALRARKTDIVRLQRVLAQEELEAGRRSGPFRPTASQFHRSVADCTRNLPLIVLMNAIADLTAGAAAALDPTTRARHRLMNTQFHRQLFEAIRAHDGDAALTIMAKHVGDIQRRVRRSLATHTGKQPFRASNGNGPRSS